MEIFKNKFLVKLIVTICLFLTLLNFIGSSKAYAFAISFETQDDSEIWGGTLLKPIIYVLTGLGDAVMELLHNSIQVQDSAIIKLDGSTEFLDILVTIFSVVVGIIVAVVAIAAIVYTGGLAAAGVAALVGATANFTISISLGTVVAGTVAGICAGVAIRHAIIPNDLYLPAFSITAEEIFANRIHLFDIDFFNPMEDDVVYEEIPLGKTVTGTTAWIYQVEDFVEDIYPSNENGWFDETGHIIAGISEEEMNETGFNKDRLKKYAKKKMVPETIAEPMSDLTGNPEAWLVYAFTYIDKRDRDNYIQAIQKNHKTNIKANSVARSKLEEEMGKYSSDSNSIKDISADFEILPSYLEGRDPAKDYDYDIYTYLYNFEGRNENQNDTYIYITLYLDFKEGGMTESYTDGSGIQQTRTLQDAVLIVRLDLEDYEGVGVPATQTVIKGVKRSTAGQLKGIVSTWYFILRNIALLVLMLILIYTGIRIVLGSTAGEKAKYKERLMDWLVAVCLVMLMHYIMVFSISLVEEITKLVASTTNGNGVYLQLTTEQAKDAKEKLVAFHEEMGVLLNSSDEPIKDLNSETVSALQWPTDLAGLFRIQSQMEKEGTANWVGYSLCYLVLVLFTLFFAFTYVRRVVYMAFLTMIAPLVAMTYPIDKMTDGKAQAFDAWFKEYIFNLMIQPLHLLLYTVLVSSAYVLASESPLYALVAVGFMMPAEKLMRRFFGFEKAKTPGLLGGAAGAAIAMTGLQKVFGGHKHHGGKSGGNTSHSENSKDKNRINFANKNKINAMDAISDGMPISQPEESESTIRVKPEQQPKQEGATIRKQPVPAIGQGLAHSNKRVTARVAQKPSVSQNVPVSSKPPVSQNVPVSPKPPEKPKRHIARAVGRATLGVVKGAGKQLAVGALTGIHPLRLAGKIATGAAGAVTAGLFGIASGDPSNVFKYTTTGAVAGSALAGSFSGGKNILPNDFMQDVQMAYYGEDYSDVYKEKMIDKQRRELEESRENINYLRQTMAVDEEQARKILETTGDRCFDNGITDIEDIATIHKLTHGEEPMSFEKAVAARTYAKKRLGGADVDQMTADKVKEYKNKWANEYMEKYKNLEKKQAQELAQKSMDAAIRFNKARSSLTKM